MLGKEWNKYVQLKSKRPELFSNNGPIKIVTDEEIIREYEEKHNRKIGVVYESAYNMLLVDLVYEYEGQYYAYERVVPMVEGQAVVVLPIYKGKIILLKQYRHAIREFQYAVPRGFAEQGLSSEDNARKELIEEIGAVVGEAIYLGEVIADSGLSSSKVAVYGCEVLEYNKDHREEGIVEIIEIGLDELKSMVANKEITDGYTLAAIEMYNNLKG